MSCSSACVPVKKPKSMINYSRLCDFNAESTGAYMYASLGGYTQNTTGNSDSLLFLETSESLTSPFSDSSSVISTIRQTLTQVSVDPFIAFLPSVSQAAVNLLEPLTLNFYVLVDTSGSITNFTLPSYPTFSCTFPAGDYTPSTTYPTLLNSNLGVGKLDLSSHHVSVPVYQLPTVSVALNVAIPSGATFTTIVESVYNGGFSVIETTANIFGVNLTYTVN